MCQVCFKKILQKVLRVFQKSFHEVLFLSLVVAWISLQLPEQMEGLFDQRPENGINNSISCLDNSISCFEKKKNFLKDSRHTRRLRFDMYDPLRLGIRELGVNSPLVKKQSKKLCFCKGQIRKFKLIT